jgi:tRNA 2-thiouridine synthesizing protein A
MPVIVLARQITQVPVGAVLRVIADDPAAAYDVPAWCRMRGQEYLASTPAGDGSPGAGGPAVAYDIRRVS